MNTETVPSFSPLVEVGLNLPPPLPLLVLFCILICTTIAFQSQFSYTQYSLSYKIHVISCHSPFLILSPSCKAYLCVSLLLLSDVAVPFQS